MIICSLIKPILYIVIHTWGERREEKGKEGKKGRGVGGKKKKGPKPKKKVVIIISLINFIFSVRV